MSSAVHGASPEDSGEHPITRAPAPAEPDAPRPPEHPSFEDLDTEEIPTRVHKLEEHEVRAIFEGTAERSVDVSGLELEDLPTRAVPSNAPIRAVSLSDDGIVVPIEVFEPLPETGVRSRASTSRITRPRRTWIERVMRAVARVLAMR
ncbi:hypothetical protein [Sandaracinus amylolyticus]|uniref:Uncharacterized protein n=1 Tax=Sandaracinus amylolyticus TaxID=927083 RepID=A0A0F6SG09_9BACT|nr:hypothetical protein [Sandaracinus amylolyticus]AKF07874.1 hypothetical protein DB32_005023 [Sandaracinus amylolyticus]